MPDSGDLALVRAAPPKALLRFLTCGSVDDGKSTLIGRLLHDAGHVTEDQLAALERDSRRHGTAGPDLDFALLLDGLEAEREQGITIDVAYRYFSTGRRSFIVADTPGHEQYTRNMATAASGAELAVILVDVRKGVSAQTRRHSSIAALLGIRQVVIAVNKMDLVGWDQARFAAVEAEYRSFAASLGFEQVAAIPLSARSGDNVRSRGAQAAWWRGPTLLEHLESVDVKAAAAAPFRFAVQWVNRSSADFRGYAGTVASGVVQVGDEVVLAGSGRAARVSRIVTADGDLQRAEVGDAVTLCFADEIDIARGELLSGPRDRPQSDDRFSAQLLWLDDAPLEPGRAYLLKIGAREVSARLTPARWAGDREQGAPVPSALNANDIALCDVTAAAPVAFDAYARNRRTGAFILIDPATNATVGAGLIERSLRRAQEVHRQDAPVRRGDRERLHGHGGACVWLTGLSGAGKSTIAGLVERKLHARGLRTYLLDGDNLRHGLCADLGFSPPDRAENVRRVAEVARLFVDSGAVVLCSLISPFQTGRDAARALFADGEFVEVHVDTAPEVCAERDPKGLYARAHAGAIPDFTGVSARYEAPENPELVIDGASATPEACADAVLAAVLVRLRQS